VERLLHRYPLSAVGGNGYHIWELAMQRTSFIPPGPSKWSLDEYLQLPDDGKRYQILDGNLDVTAAPVPRHQKISHRLETLLTLQLENAGKGEVYHAPIDVILDRYNIVQPDVLFIRSDRLSIIGEENIQGVPDLFVEVLSPTTRRIDVLVKAPIYARFGVQSYWIVDPDVDRIEFYQREGKGYRLTATVSSPDVALPPEFPGLNLPLAEIFR
jgi:Uma2 family endonuclease